MITPPDIDSWRYSCPTCGAIFIGGRGLEIFYCPSCNSWMTGLGVESELQAMEMGTGGHGSLAEVWSSAGDGEEEVSPTDWLPDPKDRVDDHQE